MSTADEGTMLDQGTLGLPFHFCRPPGSPLPHARWQCSCGVIWTAWSVRYALDGLRWRMGSGDFDMAVWQMESRREARRRRRAESRKAKP